MKCKFYLTLNRLLLRFAFNVSNRCDPALYKRTWYISWMGNLQLFAYVSLLPLDSSDTNKKYHKWFMHLKSLIPLNNTFDMTLDKFISLLSTMATGCLRMINLSKFC